jgi:cytochrome b561
LVLAIVPLGIAMGNVGEGRLADTLYDLHRSLGVLLMPVLLLRLIYRASFTAPPLPSDIPRLQRLVATAVHHLLYLLLVIQPLLGWVASSAYRAPITVFWLFDLPPIWPEDRALSDRLFELHESIGIAIAILLCAHIAGALFHHFIRRDDVLLRMWPQAPR